MTNAATEIARLLLEAELERQRRGAEAITESQRRHLHRLRRQVGAEVWQRACDRLGLGGDIRQLTRREASLLIGELEWLRGGGG